MDRDRKIIMWDELPREGLRHTDSDNGRVYPPELLQREIARLQRCVHKGESLARPCPATLLDEDVDVTQFVRNLRLDKTEIQAEIEIPVVHESDERFKTVMAALRGELPGVSMGCSWQGTIDEHGELRLNLQSTALVASDGTTFPLPNTRGDRK